MPWKKITDMNMRELLAIDPQIGRLLNLKEFLYIFRIFRGLWEWKRKSVPKYHPITKAGKCATSFCNAHMVLQHQSMQQLFAWQMIYKMEKMKMPAPIYFAGIPTGATKLGETLTTIWPCRHVELKKRKDGYIYLDSVIERDSSVLMIDDLVTEGTASKEGARAIAVPCYQKGINIDIYHTILAIMHRGESWLSISGPGLGLFKIESLAHFPIITWPQKRCPWCKAGSKPIKAKNPMSNWDLLMEMELLKAA